MTAAANPLQAARSRIQGRVRRLFAGLCCAWLLLPVSMPAARAAADEHVLVLGRISDDPKLHYDQLKPLLDYVVPRMRGVGITSGRILMARDPQQMVSYMRRGRVDWVSETASMAVQLRDRAGAKPFLETERSGVSEYRTVFFTRRDSGIHSLADLRGRSVALQQVSSTSAYVAPVIKMLNAGLSLEIMVSPNERPDADAVGYVFAQSEFNMATWVDKRLVDAGAFSNLDWPRILQRAPGFADDMVIFAQTESYPRAVEVMRGDLSPAVSARLREVLLGAAHDPAATKALASFFGTTGFSELTPSAQTALQHMADGVQRIRREIE